MSYNSNEKKQDPRDVFPVYTRSTYHSAAKRIRKSIGSEQISKRDEKIVENWRASHRHILNAWQVTLRARTNNADIIFAQRLKRRNTIYNKLEREPTMSLIKMHDIAGCRLIFKNHDDMVSYISELHKSKKIKHKLMKEYNYIKRKHPKNTGYRGIHDEYLYCSRKATDRSDRWDGLFLEIQYRTIYQHAWATAVEVVDMITSNNIKFNQGVDEQKDFFRLTSEIIARVYEGQHSCYPELTNLELASKFIEIETRTNLLHLLKQIRISQKQPNWKNCVILHLQNTPSNKPLLNVRQFRSFSEANKQYFDLEKQYPHDDIVLVRTNDNSAGKSIKDAFRNYFSDAQDFIEYVESGIKRLQQEDELRPQKANLTLYDPLIQEELPLWK